MMIFCIVFAVLIYLLIGYCIGMVLRDGYIIYILVGMLTNNICRNLGHNSHLRHY